MAKSFVPNSVLTPQQTQLRSFANRANYLLGELNKLTQETFDYVWSDPEENFAAMGDKAESNMEDHARSVAYLIANGFDVPEKYRSAPQAYTVHDDGSITVN